MSDAPKPEAPAARPPKAATRENDPSEREIDSPNLLTLWLLGAVFVVTAGTWGAARFACNMHPPESRPAPKVATDRLLLTPKDAAVEFVQRLRSSDYDGALETCAGEAAQEVMKLKAECATNANDCARRREAAAGRLTTAVVLRQDDARADTRVTTQLKGTTETYAVSVAKDGPVWKAVAKTAL